MSIKTPNIAKIALFALFSLIFAISPVFGQNVACTTSATQNATSVLITILCPIPAPIALPPVTVTPHFVALAWQSPNNSFNVYKSSVSGSGYVKINSAPVTQAAFIDSTVRAGQKVFYVVTSVDAAGNESPKSLEVSAQLSTP